MFDDKKGCTGKIKNDRANELKLTLCRKLVGFLFKDEPAITHDSDPAITHDGDPAITHDIPQ